MNKITGYQYIDQPAAKLLEKLPNNLQIDLEKITLSVNQKGILKVNNTLPILNR